MLDAKTKILYAIFGVVFLLGAGLILYPPISNFVNSQNQAKITTNYDIAVDDAAIERKEMMLKDAIYYNAALSAQHSLFYNPSEISGYQNILDVTGTGIMGYVKIPYNDVPIPIYHDVNEGALQIGACHLEGSSFPIGGENTHSVIYAHRGLPTAELFTEIDMMREGDTFQITVLNNKMTYEVDKISIVEPDDPSNLLIVDGMDYCTLMTCTPYGVNTHRLLVRGHRVANDAPVVSNEVYKFPVLATMLVITVIVSAIILIIRHIIRRKRAQ